MSIFHTIKTVIKAVANTSAEETRRAPLPGELETLVMEEIRLLIRIGLEFTAYTVTQNLRAKYPGIEIMHRAVRPIIFKAEGSEALNFDLPADWHTTHREVNGSRVRVFVPGPAPEPEYDDDDDDWYDDDDDWDDDDDDDWDDDDEVLEAYETPRSTFLRDFVKLYFDRKIAIGQPFTAWDITQAMRADNPGAELPHGEAIRDIVHSFDVPDGWTVIWNPDMGPIGARVFTPDTPSSEGDGETDIEAHVNLVNSMVDWSLVPPALRPRSMADDDDLDAWMDENPDLTAQGAMKVLDGILDALKEEVEETLDDNVKLIRDLKRSAIEDFDVRSIGKVLFFIIGNMMSNPDVDRFTIEEIANGASWDPVFIRERIKEENWYNPGWMNWGWGASDGAFIRYRGPREWFAENRESDSEWPYDLRAAYSEWCSDLKLGGMHPGWRQMTVTELFDIDPSVSARAISVVQQVFYRLVAIGQPFTAYQVTLELRRDLPRYHINNLHVQIVLFDIPVPDGWGRAIVEHDTGGHVMLYRPINKES